MSEVIINDTTPREQFTATNGQTVFNVLFTADVGSDVDVYARASGATANDLTQLVSPNDYNITFIGGSETVRVTFLVGRTLNDIITIARNTPAERLNLYGNTNFTPDMLNQDFGILTLVDQQNEMYDKVIAPHYNVSAIIDAGPPTPADVILPILPAGHTWRKNDPNTAIETVAIPSGGSAPADATFLIKTANADLPNAQVMGALSSGFVVNTTVTGVQSTRTLTGTTNQINISNGNGVAGNPTFTISSTLDIPGTFTIQNSVDITSIIDDDTFGTALSTNIPTSESVKAYVDAQLSIGPVQSITGTANQVLVNATSGVPVGGVITLTLPQSIATTSSPTFNDLTLSGGTINDLNGNAVLNLIDTPVAVNSITVRNSITMESPSVSVSGTDANITVTIAAKGTSPVSLSTDAPTQPIIIFSGTTGDHITRFIMADTATDRSVTWQDASGTVAFVASTVASITGTANQVIASAATGAVTLSLPQSIATTSSPTFAALTLTNPLTGANGGTGVNNAFTITLAGNLVTSGANSITFTSTGATNVTLPTSGTLVNTAVTTLSSLVSVGTITTGVWNGTIVSPIFGGTGVNNGTNTITLAGTLATAGAFATTFTMTAATGVTFPTTGTLATLAGGEALTNKTQVGVDNLLLDGNTFSTTNANGNMILLPNGTGQITRPGQIAFEAFVGANINNCTGDGTLFAIILDSTRQNIQTGYNVATGLFTAAVTGTYGFTFSVYAGGITAGHTSMIARLVASTGVNYFCSYLTPLTIVDAGEIVLSGSFIIKMTAADTIGPFITVSGGAKVVDVLTPFTIFTGVFLG